MRLPASLAGALAGTIATLPMTASMVLMHRELPFWERYPLPPRQITSRLAAAAGVRDDLDERQKVGATLLGHFAYGAAAGAIYAPLALPLPWPLQGRAFGLLVWTVSYLGWLPALGVAGGDEAPRRPQRPHDRRPPGLGERARRAR